MPLAGTVCRNLCWGCQGWSNFAVSCILC